jgi:hypothetical protein
MRPALSIAKEPQPTAQALQLLQSCLRFKPNHLNVLGIAKAAPNGQMYLQYGLSINKEMPSMTQTNKP